VKDKKAHAANDIFLLNLPDVPAIIDPRAILILFARYRVHGECDLKVIKYVIISTVFLCS
jgi:hypothetical protein